MKFLKLLSVFLALTLTVSMALPVAADTAEIVASGQCGENVYWKLDEGGLLLITGNGPMYNFSSGFPAPWAYLYRSIEVVFLSNGITTIGSNTFWCPNPFGQFTFANITIPRSVSYIDPTAFLSCPYLQGVYFGDTYDRWVALIENTQEERLQSIALHASDGDVNMCGIYTHWKYNDGTLTISGNGPMMDYWSTSSYTPWHLSRECIYTTKIVVEQGVTHVGDRAFYGSWAKELVLADSVVSVGNHAFQGCDFETVHLGSNLIWIGESAFEGCDCLRTVTLPSTLIATGPFAFRGCTKLLAANLGGLTTLSQEVFSGSSNLIAVHIPSSVSTMEWDAFYKSGLRYVFYEGSAAQWRQICDEGGNEAVTGAKIQYNTDMDTAAYYLENIHLLCDHDYGDWTNEGSTHNRICQNCNYTDAVEHSWDEGRITTQPRCNHKGVTTYKCTTCDATKREYIESLPHTFGNYIAEVTGNHRRICKVCHENVYEEHVWDEGKVTREPTCKTWGTYHYTCILCHDTDFEILEKLTTHTYSSANDTQCDICGYERDLPSGGDETTSHTWNSGAITKKATCKEEGIKTYTCTTCNATTTESIAKLATHTYNHACDADCNVCGVTRTTTHNYKTSWSSDKTNHWHECSVCNHKKEVAAHTPGAEATETKAQTCTTCGYVIKAALGHKHNYATTWTTDDTGHWYACSGCEERGSYADHDFENVCDPDCSVCGFARETEHKFAETWTTDASNHWLVCSDCAEKESYAAHDFENACDKDCSICGYTRETGHKFSVTWTTDVNSHWHVCSGCSLKQDEAAHISGAEATATTAQTCTICGYEIAPALGVEDSTKPSKDADTTAPTVPADQNNSGGNGSSVWIVIVIAIVAIGGIVAFVVIKK